MSKGKKSDQIKRPPDIIAAGQSLAGSLEVGGRLVAEALAKLLNERHLYQSVSVEIGSLEEASKTAYFAATPKEAISRVVGEFWLSKSEERKLPQTSHKVLHYDFPLVRSYCAQCRADNPFNLVLDGVQVPFTIYFRGGENGAVQIMSFPLQCQGCKGAPVVFMVKRRGLKLTLVGRSEFEEVSVPGYVPKDQHTFYSGAVIAYNCGQTLAALFLLRTLVEQFMRLKTGASPDLRGDELGRKYNAGLSAEFKSRFPSLPESYGSLSQALHEAREDEELFRKELDRVCKHLEAKDVYDRNAVH